MCEFLKINTSDVKTRKAPYTEKNWRTYRASAYLLIRHNIMTYLQRPNMETLISFSAKFSGVARAFPGGDSATRRAKMRKKISKVWGKIRKTDRNWGKMRKVELLPTQDCEAIENLHAIWVLNVLLCLWRCYCISQLHLKPKTLQLLMPILQTLTKIIEISGNTETLSNVSPNKMLLFLNDQ